MMKNKPRVCIIRQFYFPQEVHLRRDVKALMNAGFSVDIICARESKEKFHEVWMGINVYRIPLTHKRGKPLRYIYEYFSFFVLCSIVLSVLHLKKRYRIIEVDTMPDFLVFSTIVPRVLGARIILYQFENMPILFAEKYDLRKNSPIIITLKAIERLAVAYADKVILTHHRSEQYFLNKSTLVPNVPDEEMFLRNIGECKNTGKNTSAFLIVTHSTFTQTYGIQNIIKAIPLLKEKYPFLRCEIIGTGEYYEELVELSRNLGTDSLIRFKGYIPFEELASHLLKADVGVVSILSDYLLPNKLFEYICLGIPVICSDARVIKLFFGRDEILFYKRDDYNTLASAIEWVINNYAQALVMAKMLKRRYQNEFCWQKMKYKYLNIYWELIK